jgi:PAS domain S-box-containing protein
MTGTPASSTAIATVLAESPRPVIVIDLSTVTVLSANAAAYDFLGRPADSLVGVPAHDLVRPGERVAVDESARLLASGAIDGYRAVRHSETGDRSTLPVQAWVQTVTVDGQSYGLATGTDIDLP